MKIVLDTNVLLAAFGTHGLCEALFAACLAEHDICVSEPILEGLKKHLKGKFKLAQGRVNEIADFLRAECVVVQPAAVASDACRDPDDLMVLGTALAASAEYIVTGDKDLLVLKRFESVSILSPRLFYERLK